MKRSPMLVGIALLCLVASAAAAKGKGAAAPQPQPATPAPAAGNPAASAFEASPAWGKVDPVLQAAYKDAMAANDPDRRLDCFVRDRDQLDQGDQSFLMSKGFNVRATSGNIATGNVRAGDLQDVAELPFVAWIKPSK